MSRGEIRTVVKMLVYGRMPPITFRGLMGATRIEKLQGRKIREVEFPTRGDQDSRFRSRECRVIKSTLKGTEKAWLQKINRILNVICTPHSAAHIFLGQKKRETLADKRMTKKLEASRQVLGLLRANTF